MTHRRLRLYFMLMEGIWKGLLNGDDTPEAETEKEKIQDEN